MIFGKRFISAILAALAVFAAAPKALAYGDGAGASALYEPETGTFLYEKNAGERRLIASVTKIMTALIVLENAGLTETVEIPKECEGVEGSSLYLKAGEKLSVLELLYALMLRSANDAAVALAVHSAGSAEAFAELMNSRAAELGLNNTHFENPHGLDGPEHYSCARDLAILAAEALENDVFRLIVSTKGVSAGGRRYENHNRLLSAAEGIIGVKTGYTMAAGRTLVTAAEREGMRLIFVTLSDPDDWEDHEKTYGEAFSRHRLLKTPEAGGEYMRVPVVSGKRDSAAVTPEADAAFLIEADDEVTEEIFLPRFVYAPVTSGDRAGELIYSVNGREVFRTGLVFAESAEAAEPEKPDPFRWLRELFGG